MNVFIPLAVAVLEAVGLVTPGMCVAIFSDSPVFYQVELVTTKRVAGSGMASTNILSRPLMPAASQCSSRICTESGRKSIVEASYVYEDAPLVVGVSKSCQLKSACPVRRLTSAAI